MKAMLLTRPVRLAVKGKSWMAFFPRFSATLAALVLAQGAIASEVSPADSIRRFFELLREGRVQDAANSALFPQEQAKIRFIEEWTEKARSLSGYTVEGWTLESKKGWAEVTLHFGGKGNDQKLKIGLLKSNGLWTTTPQKDVEPDFRAPPIPPKIKDSEDLVHVASVTRNDRIELSAVNNAPFSVLFRLEMTLPDHLLPDHPLPLEGILPPGKDSIPLCTLRVLGEASWKYSQSYTVKRADDHGEIARPGVLAPLPKVSVKEDPRFFFNGEYAYGLPYPAGNAYLIWQGPGGSFSHSEPGSLHAIDFSMPIGSEVAAARAGVVVGIVQKNPDNREDQTPHRFSGANEVLILHLDGTIGAYAHLTPDSAKVSFGETVRKGQVIGLSGNSGYSRGPHLHFVVLGYKDRQCVSLPIRFLTADGTPVAPSEGLIFFAEKEGTAKITHKETSPRWIVRKCYEHFDTEIHYFAKTIDFLAANKTQDLLGIELSFSRLENVRSFVELPRRIALPADGTFHDVVSLHLSKPGDKCAFAYVFRRVEPPGKEHIPLRTERNDADAYAVEIRYFSDRIELFAENKTTRPILASLNLRSLTNLTPKEKLPRKIRLPADASAHYLATLIVVDPTEGYSFTYNIASAGE